MKSWRAVTLERVPMKQILRVEPLATWLEAFAAPTSTVTRHGDTIYVAGMPPFDPRRDASSAAGSNVSTSWCSSS